MSSSNVQSDRDRALDWLHRNATDASVRRIVLGALPERFPKPVPAGYTNTFWRQVRDGLTMLSSSQAIDLEGEESMGS